MLFKALTGGVVAAVMGLSVSMASAKTTFTLSTPDPDGSEITVAAQKFAELVIAKTNGEVEIKVFANGQLYGGDPSAGVRQLAAGSLDMLLLSTSLYAVARLSEWSARAGIDRRSGQNWDHRPRHVAAPVPPDDEFQARNHWSQGSRRHEVSRAEQSTLGRVF